MSLQGFRSTNPEHFFSRIKTADNKNHDKELTHTNCEVLVSAGDLTQAMLFVGRAKLSLHWLAIYIRARNYNACLKLRKT